MEGVRSAHDASIEAQVGPHDCGPACGVMLLRRRGVEASQRSLSRGGLAGAGPFGGMTAPALRDAMAVRARTWRWVGGAGADELTHQLLTVAAEGHGWAALLHPPGPTIGLGHWVVVDSIPEDGTVKVLDPEGAFVRYISDVTFVELWRAKVFVLGTRWRA